MKCEPVLRHCQGVSRLLVIITVNSIKIFFEDEVLEMSGKSLQVLIEQIEVYGALQKKYLPKAKKGIARQRLRLKNATFCAIHENYQ